MAGIFVNVNDDVQNLRKLKTEIENVKKALKGIDVKVDLNIKDGLESQLKSLTSQYDELASKIAETEGKIRLSTERINESTKKIIEAQEKLIGSAQGQGTTQQQTAATVTETASVQAQSKAYADLKTEIDKVLGSREENARRITEEKLAIDNLNKELKAIKKSGADNGYFTEAQTERMTQVNALLAEHKAKLSSLNQVQTNNAKIESAAAGSMTQLAKQLERMRIAYRNLTEEEQKSPFGKELLASIQKVDAELKSFDASIGNFQRNVGNYASGFNGLNMSVQQIVRELPSAAMGLNTFFLAISNNLPILVDQIKAAKVANEELKKSGTTGIPVWKQVASSLISWQTALMVGISLLSMYGNDIANWVSGLFKAKDATTSLKEAQEKVNETFKSDMGGFGEQVAIVNKLSSEWKNLGGDLNAQKKFIKENKEEFDKLGVSVTSVKDAENLLMDNTQAFIDSLAKRAKAAAAMKLAADTYEEALKKQMEVDKMADKVKVEETVTMQSSGGAVQVKTGRTLEIENKQKKLLQKDVDDLNKLAESYLNVASGQEKAYKEILSGSGIKEKESPEKKTRVRQQKDISDQILAMQRQNAQDEINLEKDSESKRVKQIKLNYKNRMAEIEKFEKELIEFRKGNLTAEDQSMLSTARGLASQKMERELNQNQYAKLLEQYRGYFEQRKAIEEKYNKDREGLIAAGASKEALGENEYQKNQALEQIDLQFAQREDEFKIWADQIVNLSIEKLNELLEQAQNELAKMEKNDPANPAISQARAKVATLKDKITDKKGDSEKPDPKADKEWKELYNTIRKVGNQFGEIGEAIGGTVGDIIGAAGEIASFTITMIDGIQTLAQDSASAIEGTSTATETAMSTVEKASVILTVISAALSIATKIASFFGADYSDYNKAKENYESYVDVLDKVIDKQKELTETMTGKDAVEASERAIELIEKQAEAARELGKMRLNAGASAGSHSIGVRTKKNMTQEGWDEALGALGAAQYNKIREGRMEGLFDLSVTQLEKLQREAPLFWAQLDGDVRDYLEQILETNEGLEDMKGTLQETLTGLAFDDFSSDVLESLYDVEKGAENIFDDMSDYMRKAMIKAMYVKNYEPEMQKWYDQWAKAMEDGVMTTQEKTSLDLLKESIITGATEAAKDINAMFENTSYYKQEATARGFETMTQDQAGELNGRFAASQVILEESRTQLTLMNATMNELKAVGLSIQDVTSSIQDLIANSYIELLVISENTGETVKCLKVIQNDIAQVKENTKNL